MDRAMLTPTKSSLTFSHLAGLRAVAGFLCAFLLLCTFGCGKKVTTEDLRQRFIDRGKDVEGYAVSEITKLDDYSFFAVSIAVNEESALFEEDLVTMQAHVFCFASEGDAAAAVERNEKQGLGHCEQNGEYVILWDEKDPFADLYKEVFSQAFAEN